MCCGTSSLYVRFALLLLLIGLVLETVGFATPMWMFNDTSGTIRIGLWNYMVCSGSVCTESLVPSSYKTDKFRVTQALEIIAIILYLVAPILVGAFVCLERTRNQKMVIVCMVVCFLIGGLVCAGMIVWLLYVDSQIAFSVGFSMGLTIAGGILAVFAGLLFIPEIYDDDSDYVNDRRNSRGKTKPYARDSRHPTSRQVAVRAVTPYDEPPRGSSRSFKSSRQTRNSYDAMPSSMSTPKTYDSMPAPMDTPKTYDSYPASMTGRNSTGGNYRPATFNNVSEVTLQRDRVFL